MGVLNNIFRGAKKYPVVTGIVIFICIVLIATIIFIGLAILIGAIFMLFLSKKGKITNEDNERIVSLLKKIQLEVSLEYVRHKILERYIIELFKSIIKIIPYRKDYSKIDKIINIDNRDLKQIIKESEGKDREKKVNIGLAYKITNNIFEYFAEILKKINKIENDTERFTKVVDNMLVIKFLLYKGKFFKIPNERLAYQFACFYNKTKESKKEKLISEANNINDIISMGTMDLDESRHELIESIEELIQKNKT